MLMCMNVVDVHVYTRIDELTMMVTAILTMSATVTMTMLVNTVVMMIMMT